MVAQYDSRWSTTTNRLSSIFHCRHDLIDAKSLTYEDGGIKIMGVSYKYGSTPLVRISILPRPYVHQQYCNIGILTAEATLEIRYNICGSKWYRSRIINRDLYRLWENRKCHYYDIP